MEFESRINLVHEDNFSEWSSYDNGPNPWLKNMFEMSTEGMVVSLKHKNGCVIEFRLKQPKSNGRRYAEDHLV